MTISIDALQRVLIATPEDSVLNITTSIARKSGCSVVVARDGREAYRILHEDEQFIGIIINLVMPYIDAPEILRFMKTERRLMRIPVVVMADQERLQLLAECHQVGILALLQKPFTSSQFISIIHLLWSHRQQQVSVATEMKETVRRRSGLVPARAELRRGRACERSSLR